MLPDDVDTLAAERVSHPWLDAKEVPVILAAGRLSEVKNYPLLLEAFARMRDERDACLMILGDGESREEIERLVAASPHAEAICLAGAVSNVFPYMRGADLLVLSSDAEGFGNVLVEAMAVGTPVVSTDCPFGPREILEDGKWGRLVPVGDADALARAMSAELGAPRNRSVSRARAFTVSAKAAEYDALARVLMEERRGRP